LPNFLRRKLLPKAGKALVGFLVNDVFNFASPIKDYVEKYLPKGTEIYGNKLRYHFGTGNEEMVQVRVCKSSLRLNYSNPGIIAGCKISLGKVKFKCDLGMHW
jgi:hypothetical protein